MNELQTLYTQLLRYLQDKPMTGGVADSAKVQDLIKQYVKHRIAQDPRYLEEG